MTTRRGFLLGAACAPVAAMVPVGVLTLPAPLEPECVRYLRSVIEMYWRDAEARHIPIARRPSIFDLAEGKRAGDITAHAAPTPAVNPGTRRPPCPDERADDHNACRLASADTRALPAGPADRGYSGAGPLAPVNFESPTDAAQACQPSRVGDCSLHATQHGGDHVQGLGEAVHGCGDA